MKGLRRRQCGVALIEALSALLILVFGVLGLLKMTATVVQTNVQSHERIQAAFLAEQLISMALSDLSNAGCYAINSAQPCGSASAQSSAAQWLAQVQSGLPGVTATANQPQGDYLSDGTFTITLRWKKPSESTPHSYTTTTNVVN
jgi:Tfp pilus assembly protein PilV